MTSETRQAIIGDLIKNGKDLLNKSHTSPTIKLWKDDVVRFLEDVYDDRLVEIFNDSFNSSIIVEYGEEQEEYEDSMQTALEFLEGLKSKQPPEKPLGSLARLMELDKKYHRNEHNKARQHGATTNNYYSIDSLGALHSGTGDIVQYISVRDIISKLSEEIQQKVPESPEKKSILHSLATLTQNPTYANIAGVLIGSLITSILNPTKVN